VTPHGNSHLRRPRGLRAGDRVALVAPASPFDIGRFESGVSELRTLGFEPVYDDSVFARDLYLAGTPSLRAAALERAWRDPSVAGVWAVRGGYGSVHLLPLLDSAWPRAHPKVFVGYSDLTTLQIWLTQQAGLVSFHGPMLEGQLARGAEGYDRDVLLRLITAPVALGELPAPALETLAHGEAAGPVFGGTLTQLVASLGTPFAFDPPAGCVLFLEDVGERPYRLDRMVTQLRLSGILGRAIGVALGTFRDCDEPGGSPSARAVLARLFEGFSGPVVAGLPVGHVDGPALALPLGVRTRIIGGATPRVIVEEPAVV
jgi:muramoyltetrapeptide carboxypeptidase